jgi:hypothetical protein
MRKGSRLLLLALVASFALSLGAGTSTASRSLQAEPAGAARMTTRALTFAEPEGLNIISEVTMTGSLHREAIAKTRGTLVGFVTRVDTANCRTSLGGFATCRSEARLNLPWHIRFETFRGTLPNITGILVRLTGFFLIEITEPFGGRRACLYRGDIGGDTNNPITTLTVQTPNTSTLFRDLLGNGCPPSGELIGTFTVSPTQRLRLL